jgi:Uma2 family endonuclease
MFEITAYAAILPVMNASSPIPGLKPHRITVDELLLFQRSGAFDELPRMELLDGTLYEMSPQTSAHVVAKNELAYRLRQAFEIKKLSQSVLTEPTLRLEQGSAPEPDIAVVRQLRVEDYYPASIVDLVIEVAVSSLQTDLVFKRQLYASASIPEYWVVDVEGKKIQQFWQPNGEDYGETGIIPLGQSISAVTINEVSIDTAGLV